MELLATEKTQARIEYMLKNRHSPYETSWRRVGRLYLPRGLVGTAFGLCPPYALRTAK